MEFVQKDHYDLQDLLHVVQILRSPQGCPWDREQTHESIRMSFVEETYEVLDAIDHRDAPLLCEELGDVLLHVVMHAQMEAEQGSFSFDEVCDGICKKMISRHPHVFSDAEKLSSTEVNKAWDLLKNKEKDRSTAQADLESVPACLPALMRAGKTQKRAARYGVGSREPAAVQAQLEQAVQALCRGAAAEPVSGQAVGELLFQTVALARVAGIDPEDALNRATDQFTARVAACEAKAAQEGKQLAEVWAQAATEQSAKG